MHAIAAAFAEKQPKQQAVADASGIVVRRSLSSVRFVFSQSQGMFVFPTWPLRWCFAHLSSS